ncbi:RING zinc finger protein, putative [Plasmodium vivax]|nr:RING zinc finger protein, putative [Plasmodium vivax]
MGEENYTPDGCSSSCSGSGGKNLDFREIQKEISEFKIKQNETFNFYLDSIDKLLEKVQKAKKNVEEKIKKKKDAIKGESDKIRGNVNVIANVSGGSAQISLSGVNTCEEKSKYDLKELIKDVKELKITEKVSEENKKFYNILLSSYRGIISLIKQETPEIFKNVNIKKSVILRLILLHFLQKGDFFMYYVLNKEILKKKKKKKMEKDTPEVSGLGQNSPSNEKMPLCNQARVAVEGGNSKNGPQNGHQADSPSDPPDCQHTSEAPATSCPKEKTNRHGQRYTVLLNNIRNAKFACSKSDLFSQLKEEYISKISFENDTEQIQFEHALIEKEVFEGYTKLHRILYHLKRFQVDTCIEWYNNCSEATRKKYVKLIYLLHCINYLMYSKEDKEKALSCLRDLMINYSENKSHISRLSTFICIGVDNFFFKNMFSSVHSKVFNFFKRAFNEEGILIRVPRRGKRAGRSGPNCENCPNCPNCLHHPHRQRDGLHHDGAAHHRDGKEGTTLASQMSEKRKKKKKKKLTTRQSSEDNQDEPSDGNRRDSRTITALSKRKEKKLAKLVQKRNEKMKKIKTNEHILKRKIKKNKENVIGKKSKKKKKKKKKNIHTASMTHQQVYGLSNKVRSTQGPLIHNDIYKEKYVHYDSDDTYGNTGEEEDGTLPLSETFIENRIDEFMRNEKRMSNPFFYDTADEHYVNGERLILPDVKYASFGGRRHSSGVCAGRAKSRGNSDADDKLNKGWYSHVFKCTKDVFVEVNAGKNEASFSRNEREENQTWRNDYNYHHRRCKNEKKEPEAVYLYELSENEFSQMYQNDTSYITYKTLKKAAQFYDHNDTKIRGSTNKNLNSGYTNFLNVSSTYCTSNSYYERGSHLCALQSRSSEGASFFKQPSGYASNISEAHSFRALTNSCFMKKPKSLKRKFAKCKFLTRSGKCEKMSEKKIKKMDTTLPSADGAAGEHVGDAARSAALLAMEEEKKKSTAEGKTENVTKTSTCDKQKGSKSARGKEKGKQDGHDDGDDDNDNDDVVGDLINSSSGTLSTKVKHVDEDFESFKEQLGGDTEQWASSSQSNKTPSSERAMLDSSEDDFHFSTSASSDENAKKDLNKVKEQVDLIKEDFIKKNTAIALLNTNNIQAYNRAILAAKNTRANKTPTDVSRIVLTHALTNREMYTLHSSLSNYKNNAEFRRICLKWKAKKEKRKERLRGKGKSSRGNDDQQKGKKKKKRKKKKKSTKGSEVGKQNKGEENQNKEGGKTVASHEGVHEKKEQPSVEQSQVGHSSPPAEEKLQESVEQEEKPTAPSNLNAENSPSTGEGKSAEVLPTQSKGGTPPENSQEGEPKMEADETVLSEKCEEGKGGNADEVHTGQGPNNESAEKVEDSHGALGEEGVIPAGSPDEAKNNPSGAGNNADYAAAPSGEEIHHSGSEAKGGKDEKGSIEVEAAGQGTNPTAEESPKDEAVERNENEGERQNLRKENEAGAGEEADDKDHPTDGEKVKRKESAEAKIRKEKKGVFLGSYKKNFKKRRYDPNFFYDEKMEAKMKRNKNERSDSKAAKSKKDGCGWFRSAKCAAGKKGSRGRGRDSDSNGEGKKKKDSSKKDKKKNKEKKKKDDDKGESKNSKDPGKEQNSASGEDAKIEKGREKSCKEKKVYVHLESPLSVLVCGGLISSKKLIEAQAILKENNKRLQEAKNSSSLTFASERHADKCLDKFGKEKNKKNKENGALFSNSLAVEVDLSGCFFFHSSFTCPISRDKSSKENPPYVLRCGHAICKSCVDKIHAQRSRQFKCPMCPQYLHLIEIIPLYFN